MYISKIHIKNFRGVSNLEVPFQKGLNVIIGENNIGKTTIIDALCMTLSQGKSEYTKRETYIQDSDFHVSEEGIMATEIEIHLYFCADTDDDRATLFEVKRIEQDDYHICFHYELDISPSSRHRIKSRVWGGEHEENIVPSSLLDNLHHTLLNALRDAEGSLTPNILKGTKVGGLYEILTQDEKEKKDSIPKSLETALGNIPYWQELLDKGKTHILEHLDEIVTKGDEKGIIFEPIVFEFQKLVNSLELKILSGKSKFSINQNGLGFNNLLYVSVVLASLKKQFELYTGEYLSLMVEEPEAHLHPQLQNIFFEYLNGITDSLGYQIFITSHSPTITAKANINSVIVLSGKEEGCMACGVNEMALSEVSQKFLMKFLDVTKSQLFYAKGVILVEGIAEKLLLQSFSELLGDKYDLEKNGVEIVNIGGVSFSHFMALFSAEDKTKRLQMKCAVLTDNDEDTEYGAERVKSLQDIKGGNVDIFTSQKTFEFQLYISQKNQTARDALIHIFSHIHPKLGKEMLEKGTIEEQGLFLTDSLAKNKTKSEFAFQLASCNLKGREFSVPEYIINAIKYVIG